MQAGKCVVTASINVAGTLWRSWVASEGGTADDEIATLGRTYSVAGAGLRDMEAAIIPAERHASRRIFTQGNQ
jgi:hypothetical protein